MSTKAVLLMVAGIVALAAGASGAFAGGIALGKAQANAEAGPASTAVLQPADGNGSLDLDQLRQQFGSGEFDPDAFADLREQFGGRFGGTGGRRFGGGDGLFGTIETIDGDTLTINTSRGPLQAAVGPETTIQIFVDGTLADLEAGMQVTVASERAADGTVVATSITVTPAGTGAFGGRSFDGEQRA